MYFDEQRQRQVLVGILHTEMVPIAWAFGLRNLQFSGAILPVAGRPYDAARNAICEQALAGGFEWVFMLDSDVIPPHDAVARLLSHNQPIVSGVYARRSPPHGLPVMQRTEGWGRSWVSSLPPRGLIEVEVVGAGCLLPDTRVLTNFAPLPAKQVGRHRALTGQGRYRRIVADRSRKFDGVAVGLSSYSYSPTVWLTDNHPVFVIPKEWAEWCKPDSPLAESLIEQFGKFVPAGQVRKGDCLATPIFRDENDINSILLSDHLEGVLIEGDSVYYKTGHHPKTGELVKYRNRIAVTKDFLEFCGFYLAEGSAGKQLEIHLGTHEKDLIERVMELAASCFGVKATIKTREGSTSIRIGGKVLGQFFRSQFGGSSETKSIPQWIMALPPSKQAGLLRGLVLGDGCVFNKLGKGAVWVNYATVSETLARQVQQLFLRLGVICLVQMSKPHAGRTLIKNDGSRRQIIGRFPVWKVNVYGKNAWWFATKILGEPQDTQAGKWQRSFIVGNCLYSPAKEPLRKSYKGLVYDFQVENDRTYVAGNFLVHNCLLIHRSVLEKLPPIAPGKHWFHWGIELAGEAAQGRIDPGYCQSEDFSFNHHCRKHGYRVLVDCSVRCRHVGLSQYDVGSVVPCESTPLT